MTPALLDWISAQQEAITELLQQWSNINSYTFNPPGLAQMTSALTHEMADLGVVERLPLPPAETIDARGDIQRHEMGDALRVLINPDAPRRILMNIHYDTVYAPESKFQHALRNGDTLTGPGVLDAKGGIIVLLTAARAFLRSPHSQNLSIEILLTPDEEIGSPGSGALLIEAAQRNHFALLYEPAMSDGALVSSRKGSGNFVFIVRGRAAHAGRDFHAGRSAILAASEIVLRLSQAFPNHPGITINCGRFEGGAALNVVPDLAIARFNARATTPHEQHLIEHTVRSLAAEFSAREGISVTVSGEFRSPPKVLDRASEHLLNIILDCGKQLGLDLPHRTSGGASDGNRIAAAGVPTIDSLGPVGAHLHSEREFVHLPSLTERAKLSALVLLKLSQG
ncbi:MAG TPA: hydrolase [Tepidisphaeraceae bacterium]|jgi:glutamate carboxypeptidase